LAGPGSLLRIFRPERRAAAPALPPPPSVECSAARAHDVHRAGENLRDQGAPAQYRRSENDLFESLIHSPTPTPSGSGRLACGADGFKKTSRDFGDHIIPPYSERLD